MDWRQGCVKVDILVLRLLLYLPACLAKIIHHTGKEQAEVIVCHVLALPSPTIASL